MKIGILGGTGHMGSGLALRLSLKHDLTIGSRSTQKAEQTAKRLQQVAQDFYKSEMVGKIIGKDNDSSIEGNEVVFETLPAAVVVSLLTGMKHRFSSSQVVVSCIVPMKRRDRLYYCSPAVAGGRNDSRSAAELVQEAVRPARVVSAFQTVPAPCLINIDSQLELDVMIAGDDDSATNKVASLVRDIPHLRPLRVGPLEESKWIESITPLLLNAAILNGLHDPSIRIVPWMPLHESSE
jgi:NADPH-dependent F420 reductase